MACADAGDLTVDLKRTNQGQELCCRAACDVTGASGSVQVGMDTGLVQVQL